MKLSELEIMYLSGARIYHQRIRGKNNYEHQMGRKKFNGSGGCEEFIPSQLKLVGVDENGDDVVFDIKSRVLTASGRTRLGDVYVNKLREKLPNSVEITNGTFPDGFWRELVKATR